MERETKTEIFASAYVHYDISPRDFIMMHDKHKHWSVTVFTHVFMYMLCHYIANTIYSLNEEIMSELEHY